MPDGVAHIQGLVFRVVDTPIRALIRYQQAELREYPKLCTPYSSRRYGIKMSDNVATQLERIQSELGQIVDARIAALEAVLQNAERMTRRLIKAEVELEHLNENESDMTVQAEALEAQLLTARARNAEIKKDHDALLNQQEELTSRSEHLTETSQALRQDVEKARAKVLEIETEANTLRTENTSLRTKAKTLQENVTRMQQLKDELMSSISGLTQQMSGLASGEPK